MNFGHPTKEDIAIAERLGIPCTHQSDATDAAVAAECVRQRARSRNGDWQHNVDFAVHGLSQDDADEVFYSRYHHREPEFT